MPYFTDKPADWTQAQWADYVQCQNEMDRENAYERAESTATEQELMVDKQLRQARASLATAERLIATTNGKRAAHVIGAQFDTAITAVDTLLELRAGDLARTAARFGVTGPRPIQLSKEQEQLMFGRASETTPADQS